METTPSSPTEPSRIVRSAGLASGLLWAALVSLWGLNIAGFLGSGAAVGVGRWLLPLALVATFARLVVWVARRLRWDARPEGPAFLVVLALALVMGFTGLAHEVGKGYYTDEGHYLHHARRLNSGDLFVRTMIYPHLLYHVDAFALWLSDLHPTATARLTEAVYGVGEGPAHDWMVLRLVAALLGSAAVVPVFLLARRLAGLPSALMASGLMIFSAHYHDGFHVNICDVPSASLAAFCWLYSERLLREERFRTYLVAGVLAGLAAATKYPAGFVAVGIVGAWAVQRWRQRDWHWGLAVAGLASIAAFVASSPSLLIFPQETLFGERGIFFGVRQYGQGGWIGVMPSSNTAYYFAQLSHNFGWMVWPLAAVGFFGLAQTQRRRWLELLPFPAAYLLLIGSMNMVVVRNLFPVIPALAVLLGIAVAGWLPLLERVQQLSPAQRRLAGVGVALALLTIPVWRTGRQTVAMARPSTRDAMDQWIRTHVPRGAGILKESYTPNFPKVWFRTLEQRFALRLPEAAFENPSWDFVLLADHAHGRFFRPEHQTFQQREWYEALFADNTLVHEEVPDPLRRGPRLLLYRLERDSELDKVLRFIPGDAFLPNPAMARPPGETTQWIVFERDGQFAMVRGELAPGDHRLSLSGTISGGRAELRDLSNRVVVDQPLVTEDGGASLDFAWPEQGKMFVYLYLGAGSELDGVVVEPAFR